MTTLKKSYTESNIEGYTTGKFYLFKNDIVYMIGQSRKIFFSTVNLKHGLYGNWTYKASAKTLGDIYKGISYNSNNGILKIKADPSFFVKATKIRSYSWDKNPPTTISSFGIDSLSRSEQLQLYYTSRIYNSIDEIFDVVPKDIIGSKEVAQDKFELIQAVFNSEIEEFLNKKKI